MSKVIKMNNSKGANTPLEFIFKDNKYKLVDFDNEWTLEQQRESKKHLGDFFSNLGSISENDIKSEMEGVSKLMQIEVPIEILALIWLDELDEGEFEYSTYLNRIEIFKKLKQKEYEIARKGFESFFSLKVPSILNDFQTTLKMMESLKQM